MITLRQFKEYQAKVDDYFKRIRNEEDVVDECYEYQENYMNEVLDDFKKAGDINDPAREAVAELLDYAIRISESGNAIVNVDSEDIARNAEAIIWDELSEYLLDSDVYEMNGYWRLDVTFGGYYIPGWDGIWDVD